MKFSLYEYLPILLIFIVAPDLPPARFCYRRSWANGNEPEPS